MKSIGDLYISKDEKLDNFNEWYKKYGKFNRLYGRNNKQKRDADYRALKTVWEESGSPLISSEPHTKEFGEKYPDRAHAIPKPFYFGRTNFGSDSIYSIKSYDDLFAELAHTSPVKNKGILGRFIDNKRYSFEHDDPSKKRWKAGDLGMYDKKMVDFPEWAEKMGIKDWWSLETKAHGVGPQYKGQGGVGKETELATAFRNLRKENYYKNIKAPRTPSKRTPSKKNTLAINSTNQKFGTSPMQQLFLQYQNGTISKDGFRSLRKIAKTNSKELKRQAKLIPQGIHGNYNSLLPNLKPYFGRKSAEV